MKKYIETGDYIKIVWGDDSVTHGTLLWRSLGIYAVNANGKLQYINLNSRNLDLIELIEKDDNE